MTTKARRVRVTLPEGLVGAADEVTAKREYSRAALVEDALRWYLRVQELAWGEASPERSRRSRGGGRKSPEASS